MTIARNETDPTGCDPHTPGAKLDAGKTEPELVERGFARALEAVARVATYGAHKYSRDGWASFPDGIRRYRNGGHRHRNAFYRGEEADPETGELHLAHECWNKLAELELMLREADNEPEL